jgi:hypothetical protein
VRRQFKVATVSVATAATRSRAAALPLFGALLFLTPGCVAVGHDLRTVSELYSDARYEAAQAWFAALRVEYVDMSSAQRAQFHYLSGMTAYRLSQPQDAIHELALAAHAAREHSSALDAGQLAVLYRTLEELTLARPAASSP